MDRNVWRENWLRSINELTSIELQEKTWFSNENPHYSFVEFMNCYFDDLFLRDNYKTVLNEGLITKQEFEIIKDWHLKLDNYTAPNNDDYNHKLILKDLNWISIVKLGEKVKNNLSTIITYEERILLNEKINVA